MEIRVSDSQVKDISDQMQPRYRIGCTLDARVLELQKIYDLKDKTILEPRVQ